MSRTARLSLSVLGILCAAPPAVMLWWSWHADKPRTVLSLLSTSALVALVTAACTRTWRRFFLVLLPMLLIGLAYAGYALTFGVVPGHTLAVLLAGASREEIQGLLMVWPQKWLLLPLAAALAAYLWLAWRLGSQPIFSTFSGMRALLALTLLGSACAATNAAQLIDGAGLNPVTGSVMFFTGALPRARAELNGSRVAKVPYHARRTGRGEEVHVLIVGESARRGSWSVYGYDRPTTPYLLGLKHEAIFLQHAMADANLTMFAVPMILTGTPPAKMGGAVTGNLLDLAKEAGYSTAWLVNQDISISTSIGISPDHLEYPPDAGTSPFGRHLPDGVLLPAYRRELARSGVSRFIGMHIMESHWEYYRRYPPQFQRFGAAGRLSMMSIALSAGSAAADVRDAYDNSVLYTDWFLQQVIEPLRALQVPATVTFIPDHGETLQLLDTGRVGHGGPFYTPSQFEIPAFVWMNDAYRRAHPAVVAAITANAGREIRSHNIFYTMADLMGIAWPGQMPEQSCASMHFVPDGSGVYLAGGRLVIQPKS
jgi:glucan phosphoethanolaminetransferase (alkaline phosphatase superfamily)